MRRAFLPIMSLAFLAFTACGKGSTGDAWAAGFANKVCPVEGGAVVTDNPALTYEYEGKKIGFCCPGCPGEFRKDPQRYMAAMRADPAKYGFREVP